MIEETKGWICLYRSLQDHWIWEDPVKLKWWIDIILLVNHKDNKILLGNELIEVKTGEHYTSILKLSDRWKTERKTVKRFLDLLEKDNMISVKTSKKGTTIKVSNYKAYQSISSGIRDNTGDNAVPTNDTTDDPTEGTTKGTTDDTTKGTTDDTTVGTTKSQQSPTNNNENNENNDNNENKGVCLGEFENVILSKKEYQELLNTHSQDFIEKYIEKLSLHMESEGKKYNSHYATIKKWINSDAEKRQAQAQQGTYQPKDEYGHDINKIRHKFGIVK